MESEYEPGEIPQTPGHMQRSVRSEQIPMHPDDYTAHLAWVNAKRSHEKTQETAVWFRVYPAGFSQTAR